MNTAIYSPSGASAGIGFAIPIDMVRASVEQLVRYGRIMRPSLGVSIAPDHLLPRLGLPEGGVLVMRVNPGSGAAAAGMRPTTRDFSGRVILGDIIVALDKAPIHTAVDLFRALEGRRVGEKLLVPVRRTESLGNDGRPRQRDMQMRIELGELSR